MIASLTEASKHHHFFLHLCSSQLAYPCSHLFHASFCAWVCQELPIHLPPLPILEASFRSQPLLYRRPEINPTAAIVLHRLARQPRRHFHTSPASTQPPPSGRTPPARPHRGSPQRGPCPGRGLLLTTAPPPAPPCMGPFCVESAMAAPAGREAGREAPQTRPLGLRARTPAPPPPARDPPRWPQRALPARRPSRRGPAPDAA